MKVLVDQSIPAPRRDVVRETVAAMLSAALHRHPQYGQLTVVVAPGSRGWDVRIVIVDAALQWNAPPVAGIGEDLLDAVREALRRI
jgi:hypothetical protein